MTIRDELIGLVHSIENEDAAAVLDYARWLLLEEDDELSPDELADVKRGQEQLARGDSITLEGLRR